MMINKILFTFKTLSGHLSQILHVDFLNNGLQISSASIDGETKFWNAENGDCLQSILHHENQVIH